jgi:hypothetical protein
MDNQTELWPQLTCQGSYSLLLKTGEGTTPALLWKKLVTKETTSATYLPRPVSERVRVSDLRGEEFEEAIGGARAGGGDKGRGGRGDNRGELVHAPRTFAWLKGISAAFNSFASLSFQPPAASMSV